MSCVCVVKFISVMPLRRIAISATPTMMLRTPPRPPRSGMPPSTTTRMTSKSSVPLVTVRKSTAPLAADMISPASSAVSAAKT